MKITAALLGEHGVFYAQFDFIEQAIADANLATIQSLGAMLAAALVPHAMMENEVFFPAIEGRIGEGGPTTVMRMEHQEIEERLRELSDFKGAHEDIEGALARLPATRDADAARRVMKDVVLAACEHFAKEENILFPMAEQMLDARALEEMGAEWATRRGVVLA
ncbi:MAG: hemerythrin domain-containing protein [Chloroflexi bacterium]|nr:hemerythrin domain-containing protein [Chloroflexota bacterium]